MYAKTRALVDFARDCDVALVALHHGLNKGQTQTNAGYLGLTALVKALKRLKKPALLLGRHAKAVVANVHDPVRAIVFHTGFNGSVWRAVFDGVGDQVDQAAVQQRPVA